MLTVEFFYLIFWNVLLSIIWFKSDWILYYSQLLGVAPNFRLQYSKFIKTNSNLFFPDFLYKCSLDTDNKIKKFILKMISCPVCFLFWSSVIGSSIMQDVRLTAPIYVISLFIFLQIKNSI
jgi:hypothetical protein